MIQGCITPRWHHRQFKNLKLYSICRTRRRVPSDCGGVFSSRLLIISVPYARSGSLTLSNMCQTLFKRVKLFNTPTYERRKSSHVHNLAHGAECIGRCGRQRAFICNSRLNPRVHLYETRRGPAAILICTVSPRGGERRGGEEQDGDISTTLQCIIQKGGDTGSPPNWLRSLYSATTAVKTLPRWWSRVRIAAHTFKVYKCIYTSQYEAQSGRGDTARLIDAWTENIFCELLFGCWMVHLSVLHRRTANFLFSAELTWMGKK